MSTHIFWWSQLGGCWENTRDAVCGHPARKQSPPQRIISPQMPMVPRWQTVLVGYRHLIIPMPQAHRHSPIKFHKLSPKDHFDWHAELMRWKEKISSVCSICRQGLFVFFLIVSEKKKNYFATVHLWEEETGINFRSFFELQTPMFMSIWCGAEILTDYSRVLVTLYNTQCLWDSKRRPDHCPLECQGSLA